MRYRIYRDRNLVKYSDIPNIAFKKTGFLHAFRLPKRCSKKNLTNAPRAQGARHGCCLKSTPRQGGKSESGEDEYWRTVRAVQKQPRCKFFTTPRPPHTEGGGTFVARAPEHPQFLKDVSSDTSECRYYVSSPTLHLIRRIQKKAAPFRPGSPRFQATLRWRNMFPTFRCCT